MSEHVAQFDRQDQPQFMREYLAAAAGSTGIQKVRAIGRARWDLPTPARLLDAGSGNGEVARELAATPGTEVVALDFSPESTAQALRAHDGNPVTYRTGDITDLPFGDGEFDGVRAERVIQHVADADQAVAELTRVLRPGGRMCLIDTDWDSLFIDGSPSTINERAQALLKVVQQGRPEEARSCGRTLRRRMVQAGLRDVRAEPVTFAFTDRAEANQVVPMERESPMTAALGPALQAALDDVEQAAADGTFLLTLTIWVVTGSRAG